MKKNSRIISGIIVLCLTITSLSTAVFASDSGTQQLDRFKFASQELMRKFIIDSDKDVYDILNFEFENEQLLETNSTLEYTAVARVQERLKARDVSEMQYVKGYLDGIGLDSPEQVTTNNMKRFVQRNLSSAVSSYDVTLRTREVVENANQRIEDLKNNIGKINNFGYSFKTVIDKSHVDKLDEETIKLFAVDSMGEIVDINELRLRTPEEIYQSGYNDAAKLISSVVSPRWVATPIDNWSNYDRLKAMRYAHKYWQNYNPEYEAYSADCANFVSQCIKDGGVPTNNSGGWNYGWYKDSLAWINAAALVDWMVSHGYATEESYTNTTAGNFAYTMKGQGHVVLVTINDGSRICYTAHTRNVCDQAFTSNNLNSSLSFGTNSDRYKFYVIKNFGGTVE